MVKQLELFKVKNLPKQTTIILYDCKYNIIKDDGKFLLLTNKNLHLYLYAEIYNELKLIYYVPYELSDFTNRNRKKSYSICIYDNENINNHIYFGKEYLSLETFNKIEALLFLWNNKQIILNEFLSEY